MRAKIDHSFRMFKRLFSYQKARYRELAKSHPQIVTLSALVNGVQVRRRLKPTRAVYSSCETRPSQSLK